MPKQVELTRPLPTSISDLNLAVKCLSENSQEWIALPIEERIKLVEEIHNRFPKVWGRWSEYSMTAKGISDRWIGNDREWIELANIARIHTVVLRSLKEIRRHGKPTIARGYYLLPNGQVSARVYPDSLTHSLAFRGTTVEVWLEPGVSIEEADSMQASIYKSPNKKRKVALVLGAGNASSLPPSDTFHKLFHDLSVVILKMNPVNSYLGPLLEETYQPLIERGFLRIVYGGADVGNFLVNHKLVNEVHMTGSDRTFDAIVFGPEDERKTRKETTNPLVNKPVDGELGCITPWIIVPGAWTEEDIKEQAAKMAYWMLRHEGYLCFSPRLLVMHKNWPLRKDFLRALIDSLEIIEPIKAYYPGSAETQKEFVKAHPEAIQIGGGIDEHVPWTIIPGLDPTAKDDICYRRESFSGLCGEVLIDASSTPEFLEKAVEFLNETVWGTLSATIVVSDKSLADPSVEIAVERAIENLLYGTVGLNVTGVWGFATMVAAWGGFPGSDITDIQSGNAKVGNYLMLHKPQKTVVRSPFRVKPYPFLGTSKNLHGFSKRLTEFQSNPNYLNLVKLFWSALRA
jgi:acyl-CoA reductase-like NAD-dependent aldehyde dehydrogenase